MDLIAYIFATLWAVWPLLLLALLAWIVNACRNPVKRGAIYTPSPEHLAREREKLQNTIRLTGGGSVRRGRQ
jgi:hypothetical protein